MVLFAAGAMALSRPESVQTGDSLAYTTFYMIGVSDFLCVGKRSGREADHSNISSTDVKNAWS